MTTEILDKLEKQIDKIDKAIAKYTNAQNAHDMSRRHGVSPDRNKLAGEVFEARSDLESILSIVKDDIQAERERLCADAQAEIDKQREQERADYRDYRYEQLFSHQG